MQEPNEKEHIPPISDISSSKDGRQHNVHATITKKIVFWLYLVIEIIFIAILILLLSLSWQPFEQFRLSDNFYYANQVSYQWSLGFIKDIQITNQTTCPAGFENAISFEWPGIGFGCFCQSGANISLVLQGYCSPSLIQAGCRNMPDQSAKTAHFWRNASNICVQRSSVSFLTQQKYNGQNKICGSSSSLIIVPNDQACPIVNISFTAFALENHTFTATDTENKLNTLHLVYNSTSPYSFYAYPVSKFAVSEFEFCLMDEDTGKDPQHSDFILLKQLRGCMDLGNFTTLDTMNQIDFYSNNPQMQTLTTLTGFPQPSNWDYLMGFKHFPGWTYKCRHNYDNKFSIKNAQGLLNFDFYNTYNGLYIPIVVFIGAIGILILVIIIRRIVNSSIYPIGYKQQFLLKQFLLALIRYIIDFICKLVLLCLYFTVFWISYYNWHWFKGAMNFNCFDNDITMRQRILIPYANLYYIIFSNSLSPLLIIIFMLVIDTAHFIFVYKKELSHYLVSPDGKILIKSQENQDLKWLQSNEHLNVKENVLDNPDNNNAADEQFRITMAQNIWMQDDAPVEKIKKKKKKKFKPFKKQKDDGEEQKEIGQERNREDLFNPYDLEEPAIFNSDSLNFQSLQQQSPSPNKKRRRK